MATMEVIPNDPLWTMKLEEVPEAILQCLMPGGAGHYRVGRIYNRVVARRLAVNAGYPTTREYFRRHVRVLSHGALVMFGAVARGFPREVCEKYGMSHLGALLEYERLAPVHVKPSEPGDTPVEVPRRGGMMLTKPFADCTLEDLREANAQQRARLTTGRRRSHEEHIQRFCDTLQRRLEPSARLPVEVDARIIHWRLRVRLGNLDLDDLERLTEALERDLTPHRTVG